MHDLSSQQWLITLIVYRMSDGPPGTMISLETVYEEARKFNEEVIWALSYCDNIANIHFKLAKMLFLLTHPL